MKSFWKRYARNVGGLIGLGILLTIVLVAIFASTIFPTSPWQMQGAPLLEPFEEAGFPLGTDMLGRDIAAGLAYGTRVSLFVGVVSTAFAVLLGIGIGACAGYFGGFIDDSLMRITEFFQTIPQLAMAIVLVAIFTPSLPSIVLAIALVSWPPVARLVRAEVLSLREREFVEAAVVLGRPTHKILLDEILPNAMPPVIVTASLMVATAILTEAALSFLGLGDKNYMSWGFMVGAARTMLREAPILTVFPGMAILITVLAINLAGEALNDALNPRLRERGQ
ncbi:ABC transporter permease [Rhizobiales bacterium TNE-4]|nr:ABC transporter permease [Rhizobiales bacterium TNE-4]MBV1828922.1 ABC transporter permease [Rhizobiales bacterium TNE-4]